MYGRTYWGVQRTTFIIDSEGKVSRVLHKVKPSDHDALVLAALEESSPPIV
jgi:thioredoxin-dependent peroxiredoxin